MEGPGELRCYFHHFGKGRVGERIVESAVDIAKRHVVGEAFEDQVNGETGAPDGELATQ